MAYITVENKNHTNIDEHKKISTNSKLFKCKMCDNVFEEEKKMKIHMTKYHIKGKLKKDLHKKQDELISKIKHQRFKLHKDIYKLKQKETKQKGTCSCRAK